MDRNLLTALPEALVSGMFAKARPTRVAAGRTLFVAGEPGAGCYRVDKGLLKVSALSASGGERILAIVGAGTLLGEVSLLDDAPRSATVAAVNDSELSFLSRADFSAFADKHPDVYKHLVMLLAQRLRDSNVLIASSSFLPLKGRIARVLLDLSAAFGSDVGSGRVVIRQKITQSDLASMAGISREHVSRVLNDWMRQSVVTRLSGYYCLEDPPILKREAEL